MKAGHTTLTLVLCSGCPWPAGSGDSGDSELEVPESHMDSPSEWSEREETARADTYTGASGSESGLPETGEPSRETDETTEEDSGGYELSDEIVLAYGLIDGIILGTEEEQNLGDYVATADDVNGDELADVWVVHQELTPGEAWLFHGPVRGDLTKTDADALLYSSTNIYGPSHSDDQPVASTGDLDGDGYSDVLFGNPGTGLEIEGRGAGVVMFGPFSGELDLDEPDGLVWGIAEYDYLADAAIGPGDVNGDGLADLLLGAWGVDLPGAYTEDGYCPPADEAYGGGSEPDDGERAGETYLFYGPVSGTLAASDADGTLSGEVRNDHSGSDLAPIGDVDGDGLADLLIGAEGQCESAGGAAYIVLGPASGERSLADADGKVVSSGFYDELGGSLAGSSDMDGDGLPDVLLGAPGARELYLMQSPPAGDQTVADALVTVTGHFTFVAVDIAPPADLNGDGWVDITIDAFYDSTAGRGAGAVYALLGPLSGTYELGPEEMILTGTEGDYLGVSMDMAGDTNGDGLSDLLVGVSRSDLGGTDAGAALLLLGGGAILGDL